MNMRLIAGIGAAVLQLGVLGFMAGQREAVLHSGQRVWLRTAPIDPRDKMRGDYVRLNYDISSVPRGLWRGGLEAKFSAKDGDYRAYRRQRDLPVYAVLRTGEDGVAELESLSDVPPAGGLFLAGRVNHGTADRLDVRYGIEALFTEQGRAQEIEDARAKERPGNPLNAEVAVNGKGLAVLRGYRWEPLGILATFERERVPAVTASTGVAPRPAREFVRRVKVELKNYGPEEVAIVADADGGSLRLVPDERFGLRTPYRWVGADRPAPRPSPADVIVLKPGQAHVLSVDLLEPRWFVTDTRKPGDAPSSLAKARNDWGGSYRIEYAPPPKADVTGLPNAGLIRHGRLLTRAFSVTGAMD